MIIETVYSLHSVFHSEGASVEVEIRGRVGEEVQQVEGSRNRKPAAASVFCAFELSQQLRTRVSMDSAHHPSLTSAFCLGQVSLDASSAGGTRH